MPFDPNSVLELGDSFLYEYTCANGHANKRYLAVPRYAILFDMGICAYLDGYYREAALDFAATYERFHEYCIYLMLCKKKSITDERVESLWKQMAVQSERQYGAFTVLFFMETDELPYVLPSKAIEFRNAVTHKGKFPSKEETYNYAFQVAEYVKYNINKLTDFYGFDIRGMYPAINEVRKKQRGNSDERIEGHVFPTVITQYSCGNSFESTIETFKRQFHNNYVK